MNNNYDSEKYVFQQQQKKNELKEIITDISHNFVQNQDKLIEFIKFKSKFYNYSYKNTLLIYNQNPYASFVGSFLKFKELTKELSENYNIKDESGRTPYMGVNKGEKGMNIYVPVSVTSVCVDKENYIWKPLSKCTSEEKRLANLGQLDKRTSLQFKLGTVFDISQTAIPMEYYPAIIKDSMGYTSEQHAVVFEGLKSYIENDLNIPVNIGLDDSVTCRGLCYLNGEQIVLNSRLNDTQLLSTLSHEFGHYLMHSVYAEHRDISKSQKEVEADVFSIMLENYFGIEINDTRKEHLSSSFNSFLETEKNKDAGFDEVEFIEKIINNATKVFDTHINGITKSIEEVQNNVISQTEAYNISNQIMENKADNICDSIITTFGPYINKCTDTFSFFSAIEPALVTKQMDGDIRKDIVNSIENAPSVRAVHKGIRI